MTRSNPINIQARWDNVLVPANIATERCLLIELCAESVEHRQPAREPINFALVIDCSGSMAKWRLDAAKTAAIGITESLNSKDRLSLITFDDVVTEHFSDVSMDQIGHQKARHHIGRLTAGRTTNLSAGWFKGAQFAAEVMERHNFPNGHVLLLSDGRANVGITRPEILAKHARELSDRGILSSTVGIGANYSPLQLDAIAVGGNGRLHDAETPDDIIDTVLGELGEIRNLAARDTRLHLEFPKGVELKLLTRAPVQQIGQVLQINLDTLLAGRSRPIALLSELPPYPAGSKLPFDITITWRDPVSGEQQLMGPVTTTLKVVPPTEAVAVETDYEVLIQVSDLWEATLAYQAMRYNEAGDYSRASQLYQQDFDKFCATVSKLDDSHRRIARLHKARRAVERSWTGRSKREAITMAKKRMLNEADLRRRDSGDWHDHLR